MSIVVLPRRDVPPPGRPTRPGVSESQARARARAAGTSTWSHDDARQVIETYEQLATVWDSERASYRRGPMRDALARGGAWPSGTCLEVGAGTGVLTPLLQSVWPTVLSVDLSLSMLSQSAAAMRTVADSARLPVASGRVAAVVLGDAPLFAEEVVRVLRSDGVVVWSNALGDAAPAFVTPNVLVDALTGQTPDHPWNATTSEAEWGSWCALRRAVDGR